MEGEDQRSEDEKKEEEARKGCADPEKSNGVEDIVPAIASIQIAPENNLDKIVTENSDTGERNQTTAAFEDTSATLLIPTVAEFAGEENNTSSAANPNKRKKGSVRSIKLSRTANKENTAPVAVVTATAVTNADPPRTDVELPAVESGVVTAEPDMEVDITTTEISVTCQTDFFEPRLMEVVEEQPGEVIDSPCVEPAQAEPWFAVTSAPQEPQPPAPAPSTPDEYLARPGPSWAEPSDIDYLQWSRPRHPTPGRHNLGGDVSIASELAIQSGRRQLYHGSRREYQRNAFRQSPYETMPRDSTRTTALRRSRINRGQTRGSEYSPQSSSLAHLGLYPTHQYPAPEPQFQTIRQMLRYNPHNSPLLLSPHSSGQSSSQNLLHVQMPTVPILRVPPMLHYPNNPPVVQDPGGTTIIHNPCSPSRMYPISTPEDTNRSPSILTLDIPYINPEVQQPLDLSLLPRQVPSLVPLPPLSTRPTEVRTTARSTPRTHTVTSTVTSSVNSLVYFPSTLLPNSPPKSLETEQTINIELYASCAEHLLPPPTTHRARTPTDVLPEHLQYQTWPVDHLSYTDHTEEVGTTECEWLEDIVPSESRADAEAGPSCAATEPPPVIIIEHVSPASPDAEASTSPPRPSLP